MRVANTHVAVTERPRWEWILAGAEQGGPDVLFFGKVYLMQWHDLPLPVDLYLNVQIRMCFAVFFCWGESDNCSFAKAGVDGYSIKLNHVRPRRSWTSALVRSQ